MIDPCVSIIIINWNGWEDTIECLESVFQNDYSKFNVIIIDNGSQDESIDMIKKYLDGKIVVRSDFFKFSNDNKPIKYVEYNYDYSGDRCQDNKITSEFSSNEKLFLIKCKKNYGFAEGNNIGIKYAMHLSNPGYFLLLNNDTVVDKKFLTELIKGITSRPDIGIVGPKMYYYNFDNRVDVINYAGANFFGLPSLAKHIGNRKIDIGQYDATLKTDFVNGAAILIDRHVIDSIGFLKSQYFLYWEETDFCVRARKAGYYSYYIPLSKIWHKISNSTNKISSQKTYYFTRNTFWFIRDNSRWYQYTYFLVCFFGVLIWFRLFEIVSQGGNIKNIYSFFRGIIDGLRQCC
jgi:hypothetical protein